MAQKKSVVVSTDVRDVIYKHITDIEDRSLRWVATKIGLPYGSAYSIFVQKVMILTQETLDKVNKLFETEFTLNEQ